MDVQNNSASAKLARVGDPMNELRIATARKRLAETKSEEDAIEALREIVGALLGCEEIGLFKVDGADQPFSVCWAFGADLENYDLYKTLGEEGRGRVLRGECHVDLVKDDRSKATRRAQAFIPIRRAGHTIGILAILRLLPQKIAFDAHDMDLFRLLSEEAATPLFGESTRTRSTDPASGIRS